MSHVSTAQRPSRAVPWRSRLETRLLIGIALVAGLSLAIALFAADRIVTSHSLTRTADEMRAAQLIFHRLVNQRAEFTISQCRLIAEIPVFRATIDTNDPETIRVMADEYRRSLGAKFFLVTNAQGRRLAMPGWPASGSVPLPLEKGIDAARRGRLHQGFLAVGGKLFLIACVPFLFAEEVLGTLTVGFHLDDTVAQELSRMTGSDVCFVFDTHICGSSLSKPQSDILQSSLGNTPSHHLERGSRIRNLADRRYITGTYPLSPTSHREQRGNLILLQPWEPTQSFVDEIKTALTVVLGLAFVLAMAGGRIFSRRITRPLREIVAATEMVAAGDWEHQAPEGGETEVAVMAASFNQMTANLRHWYQEAQAHSSRLAETLSQLQQAHRATLEALSRALDARDNETEGHSLRVTHYAVRLAEQLGLDGEELASLRWGALLHDIGKIGVADSILHKPARLTDEEMRIMQLHCVFGMNIVRDIPYLDRAADIIGCHHERFDGNGYPRRLAGAEIPLPARIFSVADTLDAITSDRPYRRGRSFVEALEEIERHSGSQFDPRVVGALHGLIGEFEAWRNHIQPQQYFIVDNSRF